MHNFSPNITLRDVCMFVCLSMCVFARFSFKSLLHAFCLCSSAICDSRLTLIVFSLFRFTVVVVVIVYYFVLFYFFGCYGHYAFLSFSFIFFSSMCRFYLLIWIWHYNIPQNTYVYTYSAVRRCWERDRTLFKPNTWKIWIDNWIIAFNKSV